MDCHPGTWSGREGARTRDACAECPAGTYQPAPRQANISTCMRCAPGTYVARTGAVACRKCPSGTWGADFEATECSVCPEGTWTQGSGSIRQDQCASCSAPGCAPDGSLRVDAQLVKPAYSDLGGQARSNLRAAIAGAFAHTCDVSERAVVDVAGTNGSVSIADDGNIVAFVLSVAPDSASEMASRLYSADFRSELAGLVGRVLSGRGKAAVDVLDVRPAPFVPESSTTTTASAAVAVGGDGGSAENIDPPKGPHAADVPANAGGPGDQTADDARGSSNSETPGASRSAEDGQGDEGSLVDFWPWFLAGGGVTLLLILICLVVSRRRARGKREFADAAGQPQLAAVRERVSL